MASIDKIYGTQDQYNQLYNWIAKNHAGWICYFYQDRKGWDDGNEHPISNFPEYIDYTLLVECPLEWVTDRIKEQYGESFPEITKGKKI